MATPEFWQNISSRKHSPVRPASPPASGNARYQTARGSIVGWMFLDAVTVLLAVTAATIIDFHISPVRGARGFLHNQLIQGETIGMLSCLLVGFIAVLILLNRGLQLYTPIRLTNHLHEQRLSVQACVITTLLLMGTLYLLHADMVPRRIVLLTFALVTVALSLRRGFFRALMYRRFEQGMNTRNVIIVGTGAEAHALRHHIRSIRQLGLVFKGFVYVPGVDDPSQQGSEMLGPLDRLFEFARQH